MDLWTAPSLIASPDCQAGKMKTPMGTRDRCWALEGSGYKRNKDDVSGILLVHGFLLVTKKTIRRCFDIHGVFVKRCLLSIGPDRCLLWLLWCFCHPWPTLFNVCCFTLTFKTTFGSHDASDRSRRGAFVGDHFDCGQRLRCRLGLSRTVRLTDSS